MNALDCLRFGKRVVTIGVVFLTLGSGLVGAQTVTTIKTDTSWDRTAQTLTPSSSNTVVSGNRGATYAIPGNVYTIAEAQGRLAGANLFHSFESFSIGMSDAAVFTTTTPTLNNVISRVSGTSPTTINGLLALIPAAGSNPNFFFVNPNGITFGAGAQVDVPAAFHVSTANSLRMGDTVFKAGNGSDSTLTIAAPEAFGFLGRAASASIRVDNRDANGVPSGLTNISGIGGRLTLTADDVQLSSATISVPNGGVLLVATGRDALEVDLDGTSIHAFSGAIAMTNATLTTSGAGSIRLLGGPMSLTEGSRIASNQGAQSSVGSLTLQSTADITLAGGFVRSFTSGSNAGSSIVMDAADQIAISRGGQITSVTQSSAPGGSISLRGKSVSIDGIQQSATSTGIISQAQAGLGNTGPISIRAAESIRVENGGVVSASTFSSGSTGPIDIEAASLTIDGRNTPAGFSTGIYNSVFGGTGNAGEIRADVGGLLTILGGGQIGSLTFSSGSGGSVSIRTGGMNIDGQSNPLPFITGIFAQTFSSGNAGGLQVRVADDLTLVNGGQIVASTNGKGSTGPVEIDARTLTVNENVPTALFTGVFNSAFKGSSGNAGDINVNVTDRMSLLNEGQVTSITESTGSAGNVTVKVTNGSLMIDGPGMLGTSGIFSNASQGASGDSGDVTVTVAKQLSVVNHGLISSSTWGGSAGTVKVEAASLLLDAGSIDSQANPGSTGDAGNVNVNVAGHISILNGGEIATNTFSRGSAGNIDVVAGSMLMDARGVTGFLGGVLSRALNEEQFGTSSGNAGDIRIQIAGNLSIFSSEISSSTRSVGHAGTVDVTAGSLLLDNVSGIFSQTFSGFLPISQFGNAGTVKVNVADSLSILGGSRISSNTSTNGDGGSVIVSAQTVLVGGTDSAISAGADTGSSGQGGNVEVTVAEVLSVTTGGEIATSTFSSGNAGSIAINAGSIVLNDNDAGIFSNTHGAGRAGSLSVSAAGDISIQSGASIATDTFSSGNGGSVAVTARNVSLEGLNSGILARAESSSTAGLAGSVEINAMDALTIRSGGFISTSTLSSADAGSIKVAAGSVLVSGISSSIATTTQGTGQGGNILISAGQMTVEQLADVTAETSDKGKAGNVTMTGDSLAVMSGGRIEASTSGEGRGGSIAVTATGDVIVSGVSADGQTRSGLFAKTQSPSTGTGGGGGGGTGGGGTGGGGTGGGGTGGGGTGGGGTGGGGGTAAKPGSAGDIAITAKNLLLNDGAQIDSSTTSGGAGGSVSIATAENITIAGSGTRLTSDATRGNGQGGSITLVAKNITVRDDSSVTAATGGKGNAGNINLTALDQLLLQSGGKVTTSTSGDGKGGTIVVQASRVMLDGLDTAIIADTLRPFADLTITINILHANDGDLVVQLDSPTGTRLALLSRVGGAGDNFIETKFNDNDDGAHPIASGSAPFTGTFTSREPLAQLINELAEGNWTLNVRDQATGNAGTLQNWTLQIGQQTFQSTGGDIPIPDNGLLRSTINVANPIVPTVQGTGEKNGIGGDVTVNAGTVTVRNGATMSAITRGSGKGGTVDLQVAGDVSVLNLGTIATDTFASGQAGDVHITAQNLRVNLGEVSSNSSGSLSGNAGSVGINLGGTLTLLNSGLISSSTKSILGAAGSIEANAGQIVVDGGGSAILADALVDSSGQTGSLMVDATNAITLSNGGILSIRNDATVPNPGALTPTVLSVSAPNITLKDASITAESTGNSNASDIRIHFAGNLVVDPSSITTSANLGNGGDITIGGGQLIQLDNSQITTSVGGTTGNGGDINIQANSLVLNTGFIQANTAAAGASGGNVNINVQTLLPSGNSLTIGGSELAVFQPGVFGLNVIQAAAPTGVSGTIRSTVPTLDVAGDLKGLTAKVISFGALGKDLCRMGARSSFTPVGRGGLRPSSTGMIRPEGALTQTTASGAQTGGHVAIADMRDGTRLGALAECRY